MDSLRKYVVSTYHVPDTVLCIWAASVNEANRRPCGTYVTADETDNE